MTTEGEQTQPSRNNNNLIIGLVVLALIGVVTYVAITPKNNKNQDSAEMISPSPIIALQEVQNTPQNAVQKTAGEYKNGSFESTGEYTVPGATEQLGVVVTLADGVISEVEVKQLAKLPISKKIQADFAAHFKDQVIGKNINDVALVKISGSSLTPKGFNDAIEKIKSQAKS